MQYWLVKSEPFVFSFDDLVRDGRTVWEGVRNYAARNHLRAMNEGDLVLFYHSNEGLAVVGIAKVLTTHYPDPSAEKGDWSAVDLGPVKAFKQSVSLSTIKNTESLKNIGLVRLGRLSVMPLSPEEFSIILQLGNTQL